MKQTVSKTFLDYCDHKYPALNNNIEYRKLFLYICFGTIYSKSGQGYNLSLASNLLKQFIPQERIHKYWNTYSVYSAISFLYAFKKDVLNDFEWNDATITFTGERYFRTVKNHGLDNETLDLARKELDYTGDRYYFLTGKKFNRAIQAQERRTKLDKYLEDLNSITLIPVQRYIVKSMQDVCFSGQAFLQKYNENCIAVYNAIQNLDSNEKETRQKTIERQERIIASIKEDPRVFYRPTPLGRTCRLHGEDGSVLGLKREVRKAFCKGWTECDLKSSQFIILSNLLQSKPAMDFIASKENLWKYLHSSAKDQQQLTDSRKAQYKEIIYGICFGTSKHNLLQFMKRNSIHLQDNEIIGDLLAKRQEWFREIESIGGMKDVWGNMHSLQEEGRVKDIYGNYVYAKERWAGSIAATVIQSIEMEIMSSLFEFQEDYSRTYGFQIMLFIHDGIVVSFRDKHRKETAQKRMNEALRKKAIAVGESYSIDLSAMTLEFEDL